MPDENLKIKEYNHWVLYMRPNQYFLGRVYLWAKRENALDFLEMSHEEKEEFFDIGQKVKQVLKEVFNPDLMNYASLGNIDSHLHVHFIPRYKDARVFAGVEFVDERWGMNHAPYDYDFKLPEEVLFKIRDAIRAKL